MRPTIQKNSAALFVNIVHLYGGSGSRVSLFFFAVRNVPALDLSRSQQTEFKEDASV
jgi:hypothetical protein